ncbi:MAG: hypothetical protein PW845_12340 [Pseudomonas sp.]|nr:hypothetical protein [Pseudomonas sp.]
MTISETHQQAMNNIYHQVLEKLLAHCSHAQRAAVQLLIQRLTVAAGGQPGLVGLRVFLAHGGGKTSSLALALLRAAQLSIARRQGSTFMLRVATCRHAGLGAAVYDNIQRGYSAMFLQDDPRVELLVVDDHQVRPFDHLQPMDAATGQRNRDDLLMAGHLTAGDARASFCNGCYLRLADFYPRAMAFQGGVNAWVTSDSPREQRRYLGWALRAAGQAGLAQCARPRSLPTVPWQQLARLGDAYDRALYGAAPLAPRPAMPKLAKAPVTVAVHDLVGDQLEDGWRLLVSFLGFRFSELAFGFSETDCANPLLMAHLRGLRAQYLEQRPYAEGVAQYLELATTLMRRKHIPAHLIELALGAYDTRAKLSQRRALAQQHGRDGFGLDDTQWVCLLFSPFTAQGAALAAFVQRCHPRLQDALPYFHDALRGRPVAGKWVRWLVNTSGLPMGLLQRLYRQPRVDFADPRSLIARVRASDPDKVWVTQGDAPRVLMTGR